MVQDLDEYSHAGISYQCENVEFRMNNTVVVLRRTDVEHNRNDMTEL